MNFAKPDFIQNQMEWISFVQLCTERKTSVQYDPSYVEKHSAEWKRWYEHAEPENILNNGSIPGLVLKSDFHVLLILKCLRRERFLLCLTNLLRNYYDSDTVSTFLTLTQEQDHSISSQSISSQKKKNNNNKKKRKERKVKNPLLYLNEIISNHSNSDSFSSYPPSSSDSSSEIIVTRPILFLIEEGVVDPTEKIISLAQQKRIRTNVVPMGCMSDVNQEKAEGYIRKGKLYGEWIILQNCHLIFCDSISDPEETWLNQVQSLCCASSPSSSSLPLKTKKTKKKSEKPHANYRLLLTTYISSRSSRMHSLPPWIVRHSEKMTIESTTSFGLQESMLHYYYDMNNKKTTSSSSSPSPSPSFTSLFSEILVEREDMKGRKGEVYRQFFYTLCFYHSALNTRLSRLHYHSQRQNQKATTHFNDMDLYVGVNQIHEHYLLQHSSVPTHSSVNMIQYLLGECHYGLLSNASSTVTKSMLRSSLQKIIQLTNTEKKNENQNQNQKLSTEKGQDYYYSSLQVPDTSKSLTAEDYVQHIQSTLPTSSAFDEEMTSELIGLHHIRGATSMHLHHTTTIIQGVLTSCYGGGGNSRGSGGSDSSVNESSTSTSTSWTTLTPSNVLPVKEVAFLLNTLPSEKDMFDVVEASLRMPIRYDNAYNNVLLQEMTAYNHLLQTMRADLTLLVQGLQGEAVLSNTMRTLHMELSRRNHSDNIEKNNGETAPSMIPYKWQRISYPSEKSLTMYISNLTRRLSYIHEWYKKGKPPPTIWIGCFFYVQSFLNATLQKYSRKKIIPMHHLLFTSQLMKNENYDSPPRNGIYITGLSFHGGKWDKQEELLVETEARHSWITKCPIVMLKPVTKEEVKQYPYNCPIYRTLRRDDYVISIQVPTRASQEYWELRGCALFVDV
jgi:dynein heavy chain, axonemal